MDASFERRFWEKVDQRGDDECWPWKAYLDAWGYGRLRKTASSTQVQATHAAWFFEHGEFPPEGILVCHTCDNPGCVNPKHLFLGTPSDNTQDMHNKNRHPRRCNRKLNQQKADEIRRLSKEGVSGKDLAKKFKVSRATISEVINRKTWS